MVRILTLLYLAFLSSLSWAADPPWPSLPPGTLSVILATGRDQAMVTPYGCNHGAGGADYRSAFDAWLEQCDPSVERIWISTGNVSPVEGAPSTGSAEGIYQIFQNTGYRAVGVGIEDLQSLGAGLHHLTQASHLPFFSANIVIHETGKTLFPPFLILNSRAGKIGLIGCTTHTPEFVTGAPEVGTVMTVPVIPAVRDAVALLRPQVEKLVLVSSISGMELATLLGEIPGIDLVLAHWGTFQMPQPKFESGVPILWLGGLGMGIGRWALGPQGHSLDLQTVEVTADFPGKSFDIPPCPGSTSP